MTFVTDFGIETSVRMGVIPGANGITTIASFVVKLTPGEPGLISDGGVPTGAPMILGASRN